MKRSKLSFGLILLALALALNAAGQPANGNQSQESKSKSSSPSTRNEQKRSPQKKSAVGHGRPATPHELVREITQPTPNPEKPHPDDQPKGTYYDWFWPPVWSNWALLGVAVVAGLIALKTLRVMHIQSRANRQAAQAAKASADLARLQFISAHRPKLIVRRLSINRARAVGGVSKDALGVEFIVANVGDTRATITERSFAMWIPPHGVSLPAIPPYGESDMSRLVLESGQSIPLIYAFDYTIQQDFGIAEGYAKDNANHPLLGSHMTDPIVGFLGYLMYDDEAGRQRRTAFLRYYYFTTQRFTPSDDPDYEYQD